MRKLFFTLLFLTAVSNSVSAQDEAKAKFPFGCRTWTFGFNIGIASGTAEVVLCCSPANWKTPPITCIEMRGSSNTGNVYQYIMINELENSIKKRIEVSEISLNSENVIDDEDGNKFKLKSGKYLIEKNERDERFVKVLFEKIN